ncbi:MAG: folate-binding protein YgfZ [Betaproteobacteria bacterium]|nr:folate-binding protein YgfZ [Betaproteobacteria bacterium]
MDSAKLTRYGLLSVSGADAREFLHAQLTNDIASLPADRAALAGWCSAKGRLLATFLVVPTADAFLLQLSGDLVPTVLKRLSMFVLRSKVKIADASAAWNQYGLWGEAREPKSLFAVVHQADVIVNVGERRYLCFSKEEKPTTAAEEQWALDEIRAGRPLVTAATQDLFVPQMLNYEKLGAVDFKKGCYPGQEVVARAQYRGEVKRRMVLRAVPAGAHPKPGDEIDGGIVVDSAGGEMLAVMPA